MTNSKVEFVQSCSEGESEMVAVSTIQPFFKAYQGRVLVSAELLLHPDFYIHEKQKKKNTTQQGTE